jgi:hypothetical protein
MDDEDGSKGSFRSSECSSQPRSPSSSSGFLESDSEDLSSVSPATVRQRRLRELESDSESGWFEREHHNFNLVRVPNTFLGALDSQVDSPPDRLYRCFCSHSKCTSPYFTTHLCSFERSKQHQNIVPGLWCVAALSCLLLLFIS